MELDNSLGFLINKAAGSMKYALETALRTYDLTPAQWSVLARLDQSDGRTISEIGDSLYFDRPTMSGIIRRLVSKNLLEKKQDEQDQRVARVFLTTKSRQLMERLPALAEQINARALSRFNQTETNYLKDYLRRILENMNN